MLDFLPPLDHLTDVKWSILLSCIPAMHKPVDVARRVKLPLLMPRHAANLALVANDLLRLLLHLRGLLDARVVVSDRAAVPAHSEHGPVPAHGRDAGGRPAGRHLFSGEVPYLHQPPARADGHDVRLILPAALQQAQIATVIADLAQLHRVLARRQVFAVHAVAPREREGVVHRPTYRPRAASAGDREIYGYFPTAEVEFGGRLGEGGYHR